MSQQLTERGGYAPRRLAQSLLAHFPPERDEQVADRLLRARPVDAGMLGAAFQPPVNVQRRDLRHMRGAHHVRPSAPAAERAAAAHLNVFMRP